MCMEMQHSFRKRWRIEHMNSTKTVHKLQWSHDTVADEDLRRRIVERQLHFHGRPLDDVTCDLYVDIQPLHDVCATVKGLVPSTRPFLPSSSTPPPIPLAPRFLRSSSPSSPPPGLSVASMICLLCAFSFQRRPGCVVAGERQLKSMFFGTFSCHFVCVSSACPSLPLPPARGCQCRRPQTRRARSGRT